MALTRTTTAANVLNRAAVEIGLDPATDPFATDDKSFLQLIALLNTAGEELATAYNWEFLVRSYQITTLSTDTGDYPLPADFLYMLPQTGWELSNQVPIGGPLSAQDWTYLQGANLASTTIYASFRQRQGLFSIFPQPPPDGLDIRFEYQTKNWVLDADDPLLEKDEVQKTGDLILFDKVLISRYLKVKFLEAKGLDSSKAQDDFVQMFSALTNLDKGVGAILNAGGARRGYPYLDYRNVPITNFGAP